MKAILLDEAKKWLKENCENQYNRMAVFGIMQSMPTVAYQKTPNEPLTLEELRGMANKPYWHVGLREESAAPHWSILDPLLAYHPEDYDYGEGWLAYRRPPEGEEDK